MSSQAEQTCLSLMSGRFVSWNRILLAPGSTALTPRGCLSGREPSLLKHVPDTGNSRTGNQFASLTTNLDSFFLMGSTKLVCTIPPTYTHGCGVALFYPCELFSSFIRAASNIFSPSVGIFSYIASLLNPDNSGLGYT